MNRKLISLSIGLMFVFNSYAGDPYSSNKVNETNDNPKNVIKINVLALSFLGINPTYERVLTNRSSVGLSLNFLPSIPLPGNAKTELQEDGYSDLKSTGFQITPFYRFYTNKSKGAPKGFYLEPFLRISRYKLTATYREPVPELSDPAYFYDGSMKAAFSTTTIGAGIGIGLQWQIKDRFTIDWNIIGVGLGATNVSGEMKNDQFGFTSEDREEIRQALLKTNSELDIEMGSDFVKASRTIVLPMFRTGLSLGYSF